jgi:hypothetical protein
MRTCGPAAPPRGHLDACSRTLALLVDGRVRANGPALITIDPNQLIQIKCRRWTAARPPDVHNLPSKTATSHQQISIIARSPNYMAPAVAAKNLDTP